MTAIRETARAKVNLTLKVIGRRPDGYHELESLVVFADLGDELALHGGDPAGLTISGPFAQAITGVNLIDKALSVAAKCEKQLRLGRIELDKNLPVAAGIGGGSADAAAALRALARANPDLADGIDWDAIAAAVGADVTVCLRSRAALMWGVGERVSLIETMPQMPAVLVNPGLALSTRDVFAALRAPAAAARRDEPDLPGPFAGVDAVVAYAGRIANDLEAAAISLAPAIGDVLAELKSAPGCVLAQMSGSGPTSFGIFDSDTSARSAAQAISSFEAGWWVEATRLG